MTTLRSAIENVSLNMEESCYNATFEILNSYITYRKKYLVQTKTGYATVTGSLNDWMLKQHIYGKTTHGIFVLNISKFITFDIDMKVHKKDYNKFKKWTLHKVIDALEREGFAQYLNIVNSGGKGYHIDIVFNNPIKVNVLADFGEYILKKYGLKKIIDATSGRIIAEVELRGCNLAGVKLPLGVVPAKLL